VKAARSVEVDAARLVRWRDGFVARHGNPAQPDAHGGVAELAVTRDGAALLLTGADGAIARLVPPFPWPADLTDLPAAMRFLQEIRRCAVLLVRRGGYACAVVDGDRIERSKVGTRYVQGRTAAGGWSQQRFARRRENQTQELVGATADVAARVLVGGQTPQDYSWLVTGGDSTLVDKVLADPRLRTLARLPRGPHLAVGDPRLDVVRAVPAAMRRVRVELTP
jgi:hypothetical protein